MFQGNNELIILFLSLACARFSKKCYSIFSEKVSWNNASNKCLESNEHLVTITSRKEMAYIQFLLRSQLYKQRAMLKHGVNEQIKPGAFIGKSLLKNVMFFFNHFIIILILI
jgi:hypothetical protein